MFRNVFALGLCAILGVFALKLIFGVAGGLFGAALGLFVWLASLALKLLIVLLVLYVILRIVSPETARRVRVRLDDVF